MSLAFDTLLRIASTTTPPEQRLLAMRSFAEELRWTPSFEVRGTFGVDSVGGHLVVEHGLENSATISFLKVPHRAAQLGADQLRALLAISYNNLIDRHLFVSQTDVRWVNNLTERKGEADGDRVYWIADSDLSRYLSAEHLDELTRAEGPRHSLKACDEALLEVISRWKRLLKADYPEIANRNISALFNALILVRGCEDRDLDREPGSSQALLHALGGTSGQTVNLLDVLRSALRSTGVVTSLSEFVAEDAVKPFADVDRATAFNLIKELYAPRDAAYNFNFALMSKHALSRIYERYVSLLRSDEADERTSGRQLSFVSATPIEVPLSKSGAVYTPQFIAGFFVRFLRENMTPKRFRELPSIDPACGSGIFLRTLLEMQCDPFLPGTTSTTIDRAFALAEGIDKDPNACEATRLSLALLYLIATGSLPIAARLKVRNDDAISAAMGQRLSKNFFGAVITNPPYIKLDHLRAGERELYRRYLGDRDLGRIDAYIPLVQLCLELTESGGFVCLVLPQTFMTASNAAPLRQNISNGFDIRCLVDLSAVPVFEGLGTYSMLLVIEKRRADDSSPRPAARIAQVTERVGAALQACLDGRDLRTPYCSVFSIGQGFFDAKEWVLVSPEQMYVHNRIRDLPHLSEFLTVKQGFVTGADDIFIIPKSAVPKGEERVYVDYLPDRQIGRYQLPKRIENAVFFPYDGDDPLTEKMLAARFPQTWAYLSTHAEKLTIRKSVRAGTVPWWRPERPREPTTLLRPKIVCPHLMLTPRFAIDSAGRFAVSHSPFMIANQEGDEQILLRFFCAVLNSSVCNWHLRTYAPKYARGYSRLEVKPLKSVPVPDLSRVSVTTLTTISNMVDKLSYTTEGSLDSELDYLIANVYGFTPSECRELLNIG